MFTLFYVISESNLIEREKIAQKMLRNNNG